MQTLEQSLPVADGELFYRRQGTGPAMRAQHPGGAGQIQCLYELPASFADDATDMSFSADQLGRIAAATLIVAGDRDPLYPVELALYRGLPSSALWVVPEGGHCPVFGELRERFARTALSYLDEVAR